MTQMTLNKTLIVTMEECGELTRACSKIIRHGANEKPKYRDNLLEEIADVQAMLQLVITHMNFNPDYIEKLVDKRLDKMMEPGYE
mgnify:CR=1 FL=1|tara:strand:+ start:577 stop:831 length:255 start_codon:yes stop_codon:yes gene_type:complete